jgi:hypothetical protein
LARGFMKGRWPRIPAFRSLERPRRCVASFVLHKQSQPWQEKREQTKKLVNPLLVRSDWYCVPSASSLRLVCRQREKMGKLHGKALSLTLSSMDCREETDCIVMVQMQHASALVLRGSQLKTIFLTWVNFSAVLHLRC